MATDAAYLAACRALNWRNAQLRAHGIEPMRLTEEHGHEPPLCFDFGVTEPGWIIGNASRTAWRTWSQLGPEWTADRRKALRYARREDAELAHSEDDAAWRVERYDGGTR